MSQTTVSEGPQKRSVRALCFEPSRFEFWVCFGFRASDFDFPRWVNRPRDMIAGTAGTIYTGAGCGPSSDRASRRCPEASSGSACSRWRPLRPSRHRRLTGQTRNPNDRQKYKHAAQASVFASKALTCCRFDLVWRARVVLSNETPPMARRREPTKIPASGSFHPARRYTGCRPAPGIGRGRRRPGFRHRSVSSRRVSENERLRGEPEASPNPTFLTTGRLPPRWETSWERKDCGNRAATDASMCRGTPVFCALSPSSCAIRHFPRWEGFHDGPELTELQTLSRHHGR
jgi:hypothetical protein